MTQLDRDASRLDGFLDAAPIGLARIDPDGRILAANLEFVRVLGGDVDRALPDTIGELAPAIEPACRDLMRPGEAALTRRTLTVGESPRQRSIELIGWASARSDGAPIVSLILSESPRDAVAQALNEAVERARGARDIHDGLAQDLWLAKLAASGLARNTSLDPEARALCADLLRSIDAALGEARTAIIAMSSVDVPSPPLSELIERQVDEFSDRFGIRAECHLEDDLPIAPRVAGAFGTATNATVAPAVGLLEQFEILATGKNKLAIEGADAIQAAAGATGTRVATADKAAVNIGQLVALRPTGAPPPPPDTTNPSTPADVVATAASSTRVNLTWTASTDNVAVDHYEIFRNADSTLLGTATTTSFSDTSAVADTTYTYRVVAVDAATNRSGDGVSNQVTTPAGPPPPPAGITFRSASSAGVQAASIAVPRPSGIVAGDVLVAAVDVLGTATIATPSGWTLVQADTNGALMRQATYVRVVTAGEPAAYAWTFSASSKATAVIQAYSGVNTADPIGESGGQFNGSSTSIGIPPVNVPAGGGLLVTFVGVATNATITPPTGHAERSEVTAGPGNNRIDSEGSDRLRPAGSSGPLSATASKAGLSIGQVVVLNPAP